MAFFANLRKQIRTKVELIMIENNSDVHLLAHMYGFENDEITY